MTTGIIEFDGWHSQPSTRAAGFASYSRPILSDGIRPECTDMILTDNDMDSVRQSIEAKAGLDEELLQRCGDLRHMGKFDEAVHAAFIFLEERLRTATDKDSLTGTQLANYAFGQNGPLALLATQSGYNEAEREGLRELFSGSFKLLRNPAAHGVVGYNSAECKFIIGLIDLLLGILARITEHVPPPPPPNIEKS